MKAKIKLLKAECHAHGAVLVAEGERKALHFDYRDIAFTPEIREHRNRRSTHVPVPLTTAVLPKGFKLSRA